MRRMEELPKPLVKSLFLLVIVSTLLTAGAFMYVNETVDSFNGEPSEETEEYVPEPVSSGGKVGIAIQGENDGNI
ncbi:MAG: hypothetical protein R6V53_01415 [Candidatus Woesearchaeota archaeon]